MNKIFDTYTEKIAQEYQRTGKITWAKYIPALHKEIYSKIIKGVNASYERSKPDKAESRLLRKYPELKVEGFTAVDAFINRRHSGLNLSDRVWKITDQYKESIEDILQTGISEGTSAVRLARELKKYLNEPNRLYRRVRDSNGVLKLSKSAKLYNPGRGVYRSSVKNAQRLARTEINMAYRTADHERWKASNVVVGIEIRLSNNHTTKNHKGEVVPLYDICDELVGRYPTWFKFVGFHTACRCNATPIVKTDEEARRDVRLILDGKKPSTDSVNRVVELPPKFYEWIINNYDRVLQGSSVPYFIQDNFVQGDIRLGLKNHY